MPRIFKIFLASSSELRADREAFEQFLGRENNRLVKQDIYLELLIWEDFLDSMSQTRLQDEYNNAIRQCDLFVMLFWTKVGKYTREEFELAFGQFKEQNRPKIYTYFKDAQISTGDITEQVFSLLEFKKRLGELGHFYTQYQNEEGLLLHFSQQLKKLQDGGFFGAAPPLPVNIPPSSQPVELPKGPRFGLHHQHTCDRFDQFGAFSAYLEAPQTNKRCHFFYFHGCDAQAHVSLFQRFVARLDGRDLDHMHDLESDVIVKDYQLSFPRQPKEEALKVELPRRLLAAMEISESDMQSVRDRDLAFAVKQSPELNTLTVDDKVCLLLTISERHWNKDLTPEVARWFIEQFCLQSPRLSPEQIERKALLAKGPEFFVFFSIEYDEGNQQIRTEIQEALDDAQNTMELKELQKVMKGDVEDWFDEYRQFWPKSRDRKKAFKQYFEDEEEEMYMEDVQEILEEIIIEINETEKDAHRNS